MARRLLLQSEGVVLLAALCSPASYMCSISSRITEIMKSCLRVDIIWFSLYCFPSGTFALMNTMKISYLLVCLRPTENTELKHST